MPTFSLNIGTDGSHKHNNRTGYIPPHINKDKISDNVIVLDRTLCEVLHEVFDDELERYNKGKKPSRQKHIEDIINDKKSIVEREMVGSFGDRYYRIENEEAQKNMTLEYIRSFQERNPNLKLTQCILHADEDEGSIHYHIRFVPVYEDTKGMKIKIGMNRALAQMLDTKADNNTFNQWRNREMNYAEQIIKSYGETLIEKNESRKHLTKEIYIKQQQLLEKEKALNTLERKLDNKRRALSKVKNEFISIMMDFKGYLLKHGVNSAQREMLKDIQDLKRENKVLRRELFVNNIEHKKIPFQIDRGIERTL